MVSWFFVGAGLSTLSEYPQWWELLDKYYYELYGKRKDGNYTSDEFLKIPQIYFDVKGENSYNSILKDVFSIETFYDICRINHFVDI